ncbi:hypothetical protein DPMN_145151 [Dreissena polymorpha]|uniref:Uncharacterized protein n=1 Tax=Dreissena polymorpha TaxID=45954 RepID=A0A9D4J116_DREPO|nr:hypothetical protein DPMN_145151 [Dreissena polymorpha]
MLTELCGQRVKKIDNKKTDFDIGKFFRLADQITENGTLFYEHNHVKKKHIYVVQKYIHSSNETKNFKDQLEELSKYLGRELKHWTVQLNAGAFTGATLTGGGVLIIGAIGGTTAAVAVTEAFALSLCSASAYAMRGAAVIGSGVLTLGRALGPLVLRKCW